MNTDLPDQELQDSEFQKEDTKSVEDDSEEEEETQEDTELIRELENDLQKNIEITGRQLRDRSTIKRPEKFKDYVAYVSADFREPETYTEHHKIKLAG